jgi:hypothetical protein
MSRLQRKCFLASLLGHAALLVLLVVSAGFSTGRPPQTEEVVLLTFIPDRLVDAPVIGGGTPQTASPPAAREPVVTRCRRPQHRPSPPRNPHRKRSNPNPNRSRNRPRPPPPAKNPRPNPGAKSRST